MILRLLPMTTSFITKNLFIDRGVPELGCSVVFETNKRLSCEFPTSVKSDEEIDLYEIDHIYPR